MSSDRLGFALAFLNLPDQNPEAVFQIGRRSGAGRLSRGLAEALVAGAPYDVPEDAVGLRGISEQTLEGIAAGLIGRGLRVGRPLPVDLVDRLVPPPVGDPLPPPLPDGRDWEDVDDGEDSEDGKAPRELLQQDPRPPCDGEFVSMRRSIAFYTTGGAVKVRRGAISFGAPVACDAPRTLQVPESTSIPIYWSILSGNWNRNQAQGKITEARQWFDQYCISLTLYEANLKRAQPARFAARLAAANRTGIDAYAKELGKVYREIWRRRLGRPSQFLLMLFVDDYTGRFKEKGRTRTVNVSFNIPNIPVILIPAKEVPSPHVVTHELLHGFGKISWKRAGQGKSAGVVTDPYSGKTQMNNSWTEGGCASEMGNAGRANPANPLPAKNLTAPMDWATYYQFWRSKSIRF